MARRANTTTIRGIFKLTAFAVLYNLKALSNTALCTTHLGSVWGRHRAHSVAVARAVRCIERSVWT